MVVLILLLLLLSGIPVAIGLGLVSLIGYILVLGDTGLSAYVPFNTLNSFVLTAVPLFIFMGEILLRCGISERLYRGTSRWVGGIPGGLLHSNVVSCALFAAICGSSPATAATIGTIALPALEKRNYDIPLWMGFSNFFRLHVLKKPIRLCINHKNYEALEK